MIEKLIARIARQLDAAKIPYMIIGGQAVLLYGSPRLTRDIDITLGVDTDRFSSIEKICRKLKLKVLSPSPLEFARQTKVLPAEETKSRIRVDFIFSFTPYESQAMNRVRKVTIGGYRVKFASCEDVIIHKMFAGRAIDREDVKNILLKNIDKIDLKYTRKWLSQFNRITAPDDMIKKFNTLLKQSTAR